ncbi:MAG: 50S ribosomal protein L25/general stress protein Ctc [Clostridiales bacterium]|jgi:large subunit ribosomal protein L25|nr:50S ribosomal protein L25/general stress protein Ctc [Clostridiales bacterium]
MERMQVQAKPRTTSSKGQLKKLRSEGLVPGIVYGKDTEATAVAVQSKDIHTIIHSASGANTLVDLAVGGKTETVIIKELERDILLQDRFTHVDFLQISLKDKLEVQVPVVLTGEAPGVKDGGIVQQSLREVALKCLPTEIPDQVELDISNLGMGETLTVGDLNVPAGSEFISDAHEAVVTIVALRVAGETEESAEEATPAEKTEAEEE